MGHAPGFFGKIPSHGDFVGRRLPPEVRQCFDAWLQASLLRSRQDLGEAWLPTWLSSPLWRFVVGAGVCGEQAWAGVMMPSHDRVGRCFPLLLMAGIDGTPSLRDCLTVHDGWFAGLEELALSTLDPQFSLEIFDAGLVKVSALPGGVCPFGIGCVASQPETGLVGAFDAPAMTAWWTDGSALVKAGLAVFAGLPPSAAFAGLLNGTFPQMV